MKKFYEEKPKAKYVFLDELEGKYIGYGSKAEVIADAQELNDIYEDEDDAQVFSDFNEAIEYMDMCNIVRV